MIAVGVGVGLYNYNRLKLIYDNFNRADTVTGLGNPVVGPSAWASFAAPSVWGISSGRAYLATAGAGVDRAVITVPNLPSNYAIQCQFPVIADNQRIVIKIIDASNELYVGIASGIYTLVQRVGASPVTIGSTGVTAAAGDVVRAEIRGNSISVLINGVYYLRDVAVNALFASTKTVGICSVGSVTPRFDEFLVETI